MISQVYDILGRLFPSLHSTDIDLVYRTGANHGNAPRPVFVSFIRARDKREIFQKRDSLREGTSTRWIYVNEDVPPELRGPRADMRALARHASDLGHTARAVANKLIINNRVFRANELHLLPPSLSLENVKIKNVPNGLAFQGAPAFLSNLHPASFVMRGIKFNCAEQAYQFYRAACVNNLEVSQAVLKCADPQDIREKGNKIEPNHNWDLQKDEKMKMIILNKFTQNRDLALKLIATGNIRLIEATRCPYWGAGLTLSSRDWGKGFFPGQNKLGEIIMQVRDELRPLYQQAAIPAPDTLSPAETLALATTDKADQIPVPPPHVVKQMVIHPPPSFQTENRFAPLQADDPGHSYSNINQKLQAMAATIHPTAIPSLAKKQTAVPSTAETDHRVNATQPMITDDVNTGATSSLNPKTDTISTNVSTPKTDPPRKSGEADH